MKYFKHHSGRDKTRDDLFACYPLDTTVGFNEHIAYLIAEDGLMTGPAKLPAVKNDGRVQGSLSYFYTEDASGTTYDNFLIATAEGNTRQTQWLSGDARSPYSKASRLREPERRGVINHYGSSWAFAAVIADGLRISGFNGISEDYKNMYTSKELQTGEFDQEVSSDLEMYDPATGRWLVPDPAEQFSNPYLAMGNNPVMYVDPNGEFALLIAGAVVGAYIGGAMANDHLNPGKWNFQDPNTWIGMGVGGTIGAFGGHGLMAAKGKAAFAGMSKGSAAAKAGGKKFFGSTVGGTTNAISNYDGADSFGWGTLADFGAGSFGTYYGDGNMLGTFLSGGSANVVSQFFQHKQAENLEDFGGYQIAQSFVGGGLSSMNGASFGGAKGSGIFQGKTQLGKYANSFIGYGSQATMYDFAYSSQSTFTDRSFGEHLGMFAAGGFYGTLEAESFKGKWGGGTAGKTPDWWRAVMGATAYAHDYYIGALIKGRAYGNFYSGQSQKNKGGILGFKYAVFSSMYLGY